MKVTQTGIATALALAVVLFFLILPSWWPFTNNRQPTANSQQEIIPTQNSMPETTVTQLEVRDETVGQGTTAAPGDTVTVNYVGALSNGQIFDASANHGSAGFTFVLGAGQVIAGWDQGIVGMREGGRRQLVIPASLAYGSQGIRGVIPPNATLIFEVELVKVVKKK